MITRLLTIYTAPTRKAGTWLPKSLSFSELCIKIKQPVVNSVSMAEFGKMTKADRDALKDVGGFVGGGLRDGIRSKATVEFRDLLTIDIDNIPEETDFKRLIAEKLSAESPCGSSYCLYSTRNHTPEHQRYRLVVPLDRSVSPEEYVALGRKYCEQIGILNMCDVTTFEPSRLMYWPSVCIDQTPEIVCVTDLDALSPDIILNLYDDWTDSLQLPLAESENEAVMVAGAKAAAPENPEDKGGVIGAFCSIYDIHQAIAEFIPDIYTPVEGDSNRYSYAKGSTTGGAIVYGEGKFLYSNHATDPVSGQLVNSFDLIRIHMFGSLDAKTDYKGKKYQPSYRAMMNMFETDEKIIKARKTHSMKGVADNLKNLCGANLDIGTNTGQDKKKNADKPSEILSRLGGDTEWLEGLSCDTKGKALSSLSNVVYVLRNCPYFKGRIRYDSFADVITAEAPFPWGARTNSVSTFEWGQFDYANLRVFLDGLGIKASNDMVKTALDSVISDDEDALTHYVKSLKGKWDGIKRIDTYFIDTVGAEDTPYVREATRKQILGLAARAAKPGTKFDYMLILYGGQGIGKSTAVSRLARFIGQEPFRNWYVNMTGSMDSKEFTEKFLGHWVIELAELNSLNKSDIERIKDCVTTLADTYRKPYDIKPHKYYRRGVLFGTTNEPEFLKDPSGNRRFNPIRCEGKGRLNPFELPDSYIDQIYAEAITYIEQGESLFLSEEMAKLSDEVRKNYDIIDPWEDILKNYIEMKVPEDWFRMQKDEQIRFIVRGPEDEEFKSMNLVSRTKIPYVELWVRALGQDIGKMNNPDRKRIKNIMLKHGWLNQNSKSYRCGVWGINKCFVKQ